VSSSAWTYQDLHQVKKHGADQASWYVGWYEANGRRRGESCGPGARGKALAEKKRRKIEAELMTGTYQMQTKKTWEDFRKEYRQKVLECRSPRTVEEATISLDHFERLAKPVRVFAISAVDLDGYIATRRQEKNHAGNTISPATVNKELRHIRAAVRKAHRWGYLPRVPDFEFLREPGKLPTYIPPEDFAAIYQVCDHAEYPDDQPYPAADWWRGILITAYLTGWRIGSLLALIHEPDETVPRRA
jgi:integrase